MEDLDSLLAVEEAKSRPGVACWVCSLPEREWIEKARAEGRKYSVIVAVLRHRYPDCGVHRIRNHMERHVKRA